MGVGWGEEGGSQVRKMKGFVGFIDTLQSYIFKGRGINLYDIK